MAALEDSDCQESDEFVDNEDYYLESCCSCKKPENGQMIACDSGQCLVEWYHITCVGLKPSMVSKGDWICPGCSVCESIQESLGFRPFQLVFVHNIHGPLKLIKENPISSPISRLIAPEPKSQHLCVSCKSRRLPNVIMIGSKKCGTGMFISFLARHPDVCGNAREIHYFDARYKQSLDWYRRRLPPCFPHQLVIEKSPRYFVHPKAPERIYRMNKMIKLLLIVRNPVIRLVSDFVHTKRHERRKVNFEEAVWDNVHGSLNLSYEPVPTGIYVTHLKNYLKYFDLSQIHVINGHDFIKNPLPELQKVEKYLSLRHYFKQSHFVYSKKKGFYCLLVKGKPRCGGSDKGRRHPKITNRVMNRCRDFYKQYNEQFFKVIKRRFDWF